MDGTRASSGPAQGVEPQQQAHGTAGSCTWADCATCMRNACHDTPCRLLVIIVMMMHGHDVCGVRQAAQIGGAAATAPRTSAFDACRASPRMHSLLRRGWHAMSAFGACMLAFGGLPAGPWVCSVCCPPPPPACAPDAPLLWKPPHRAALLCDHPGKRPPPIWRAIPAVALCPVLAHSNHRHRHRPGRSSSSSSRGCSLHPFAA